MSRYCDVERELIHIRGAIGQLEQAQHAFTNRSAVSDPSYWRVRLDGLRARSGRNAILERQVAELVGRLDRIRDSSVRK